MDKKKIPKESGEISRREFLKDAGLVVGGAAIGSTVLLAACGDGAVTTETVTETAAEVTKTVTTTQQVGEVTKTVTETVSTFICPIDGTEFDTLAALQAHFEAEHPAEAVPEKLTKLTVNGETYELKLEPNWTLAYVLREKLGLIGTKVSCNRGICGACTVLMDNRPVSSCTVLAVEADNKEIVTIEGLAKRGELHPIQQAFIDNTGSIECGYCSPAMIMVVKGLLDRNLNPTKEDVWETLSGVLCRCGGVYPSVVKATLEVAEKMRGG